MKKILFIFITVFGLISCHTQRCIPQIEVKDSIRVILTHDTLSVYEKDSFYIHEKSDTVWIERWSIKYRDKIKIVTDTIKLNNNTVQTSIKKVIPSFYKWCTGLFWIIIVLIIIWSGIKIYLKLH